MNIPQEFKSEYISMDEIEIIIREVAGKDSSVLCREVTSIGDIFDIGAALARNDD